MVISIQMMMIVMKVADISNEARPMEVAVPWLDCLLEEFFNQVGSLERYLHALLNVHFGWAESIMSTCMIFY